MIAKLSIERFKSIRSLTMECRKVNLFLGAPDTGKTNILDALQFLSLLGWGMPIGAELRLNESVGFEALFYRQFFDKPFVISSEQFSLVATILGPERRLKIEPTPQGAPAIVTFGSAYRLPDFHWVRSYRFEGSQAWGYQTSHHEGDKVVTPPVGYNLTYVARHDSRVYESLKDAVAAIGWKLKFDKHQNRFVLSEVRDDDIFEYNIELLSDSVKRLFFYEAILLTSRNATLVFDEPDVYAFPPYPKTLAEMIAADESNQFFLTTHNPYFLSGIVEKTPAKDLAVFVCHPDPKGGTSAKLLDTSHVAQVIEQGPSIFFNLDDFTRA